MAESKFLGRNVSLIKEHNLRAVLLTMLSEGPLSRIQLAQRTSLSATAITHLVQDLLDQGILSDYATKLPTPENRRVGRPLAKLRLVDNGRYAIGVQMQVGLYRVALANLRGELIDHIQAEFAPETPGAEQVFADISTYIEELIHRNKIKRKKIIGVGVGASGLINYVTGVNILSANLGWKNVPIRDWLQARLRLPVVVDNNVRCMALGEALFGAGRGVRSLAFVYARFGVGAGIVMDDKVLRGSNLGAGEIGHTIMVPHNGPPCRCGRCGCLETLVSEPSLARQAEQFVLEHPDSGLGQFWHTGANVRPMKRLFGAARAGDPDARRLVETSAQYLGMALASLVNLINPELILLGGLFAEGEDLILPVAKATMESNSFAGLGQQARVQATSFGWQAGMIGAAALALAKFLYLNPEEV
jgi:glucokinase-like ROK family protein